MSAPAAALLHARMQAIHHAPYFASAIWKLVPVPEPGLGTFGVDAHWRLYYDPATLAEWGPEQAGAVLAHEVGHLVRSHHQRAKALAANPTVWNFAGDAAINDDLIRAGLPLPAGAVTPENLGLPADGIEEDYYALLTQQAKARPQDFAPDPEDPGCGSGAGSPALPCERPATDTEVPAVSAATADITRRRVAEAVRAHEKGKPGSTPASLRRWAEETLAPPTVDWRAHLRTRLRRAIAWRAGQQDYTYSRRARRQLPGIILPGRREPVVSLSVVVDTSGSMSPDDLSAALSEINGIAKAGRNRSMTVVTCDAQAQVERVSDPGQVTLTGGGGTDMRVGIEAALRAKPTPDVVIVLTDGYTPWPDQPTRVPLVVGLIGSMAHAERTTVPAWATAVSIG